MANEEPITTREPERINKLCRCHNCGHEDICTPISDFYELMQHPEDPYIYCEGCFWSKVSKD